MSFLAPVSLLFGLLALPILALYMLRLRRREVQVSSTILWQILLRDRQANTPWQRLRRNLLLFLQLLLLAALVFSLARPAVPVPMVAAGSVVVLLDASASMSATDVNPTRFDAARAVVRSLISNLASDARLVVILVNQQPTVLANINGAVSTDRQASLGKLQAALPSSGKADWITAFALAAGAASAQRNLSETTFVIISDGGLPTHGLPPLPGTVRYVPIGNSAENLSLSALALRQASSQSLSPELFASVVNSGELDREVILSIYINNQLHTAQQLSVPANGQVSITLNDLPAESAIVMAALSSSQSPLDSLSLDDTAFAVYQPTQSRRVWVASEEYFRSEPDINIFLEQILASLPDVQAYRASATQESAANGFSVPDPSRDPFDLYVFDGILPGSPQSDRPELPPGNLLLINPPDNNLFSVTGTITPSQEIHGTDHPLMAFVDWQDIFVARARKIQLPIWAETLVSSGVDPLIFVGQVSGRRVAVIAFDLNDSDLPLTINFPLLFASLLDYLVPLNAFNAPDGLVPGDLLNIQPDLDVKQVSVVSPAGNITTYTPGEFGVLFNKTDELGLYAVNYLRSADAPPQVDFFAVNLFDRDESNIRVAANIQVGRGAIAPTGDEALGQRELWPWLAALALAIFFWEWWLYHRQHWLNQSWFERIHLTWNKFARREVSR